MTKPVLNPCYGSIAALELARFDDHLRYAGKSQKTRQLYLATLARLPESPLEISRPSLLRWVAYRRDAVSGGTLSLDLCALRVFYKWAHVAGMITEDHAHWVPSGRHSPKRLPRAFTEGEIGMLLAEPALDTLVGYRDHVIMRLAYETGLRASELVNLHIGDILAGDRLCYVQSGKGCVDRYQPISAEMVGLIEGWLYLRRGLRTGKSETLFVTRTGRRFSSGRSIWEIVDRYARAALGFGQGGYRRVVDTGNRRPWQGRYPHLLRASMAAHMLRRGCNIRAIQELLGHRSASTTAQYLAVDLTLLRAAVARHPRAKRR